MCTIVLSAFSQSKVFSFVILVLFFSCWFERKNSKCEWASWKQSSYLFVAPLFFYIGGSRESVTTCFMLDRVERSRVISKTQHSGQMEQVFHTQWKPLRMKTGNGGNGTVSLYGICIYTMYIKFKVLLKIFYLLCYCHCLFTQIVNMYMIHMWNYHIASHFIPASFYKTFHCILCSMWATIFPYGSSRT